MKTQLRKRRKFLEKGFLGLLSITLLPSFSFQYESSQNALGHDLFSLLSFKKSTHSLKFLDKTFQQSYDEDSHRIRTGNVFYSGDTFFIEEICKHGSGKNQTMFSIYEKESNENKKVVTLHDLELESFSKMASTLLHKGLDGHEIRNLVIPRIRTSVHRSLKGNVCTPRSSTDGYYTARGYCSLKIQVNGNRYTARTRLLNFQHLETDSYSFKLQANA